MAKAVYVSYIAVVVHLLLLLRIVTANQPGEYPSFLHARASCLTFRTL